MSERVGGNSAGPGPWGDEETRLRQGICRIGALCYQRSFIVGADGNIAAQIVPGKSQF